MAFRFKQFAIEDSKCAMKVGTDSIILGAYAPISTGQRVLDIGCGSAILALMLAQRVKGEASITGVEIDQQAANQARQNVQSSPWSQAVEVVTGDINQLSLAPTFDLIVTNPPYFSDSLKGPNDKRNQARHNDGLSREQLQQRAISSLADNGQLWLILPSDEAKHWLQPIWGLELIHQLTIQTVTSKIAKRTVLGFVHNGANKKSSNITTEYNNLTIYDQNQQYSSQFIALTRKFYLNR